MVKYFLSVVVIIISSNCVESGVINKIIAWVNNDIITLKELNTIANMSPEVSKEEILNDLINQKLIIQEAERQGIEIPDEQIDRMIETVKAQFPSDEAFKQVLYAEGTSIEELRQKYKMELLKQQIIAVQVAKNIKISQKDIKELQKNLEWEIRVKHILVKTKQEAILVIAKLDRDEIFEELAKKYSICPSSKKGGDLGFFHKYQMLSEFSDAAFKLRIGEISPIIKTKLGYHIIKMIERRRLPEEEKQDILKEQIDILKNKRFEQELKKWIKGLREKAYIVISDNFIIDFSN